VILLDVPPLSALFAALYRLGLGRLLASLDRLDCMHAVYGSGSFFEGRPLHGLSDIDLVLVIDERFSRLDLEPQEVIRTYGRVRRWFPFLGRWDEKAENLVSLAAFGDCLAREASAPRFLFAGKRSLGRGCTIRPVGKWTGFKALLQGMIVGVGLYQGVEFLLRTSILDLLGLARLGLSRTRAARALLRRSEVHVVELGRDAEANVEALRSFFAAKGFGAPGKGR
jgi:predicted nucleotidyltransferase